MDANQEKSNEPRNTAFQQQRLSAWQPLLTPKWVIGLFVIIGLIFVPIGSVILVASRSVVEYEQRYDNTCTLNTTCTLTLNIDEDMDAPVYFYYKLSNYYQNHRRYVKSRSDSQLRNDGAADDSCDPLSSFEGKDLYPCGLIAQSLFNDTFAATLTRDSSSSMLTGDSWTNQGIAWSSDREEKFQYRPPKPSETDVGPGGFRVWTPQNNEEFIVWMRTAGLPTFKKLHRRVLDTDLKAGDVLTLSVGNNYPVGGFDGEKAVVLSTTSWLGGRNDFLGIAYIVVGSLSLTFALVFFLKHYFSPRRLGDMSYFEWSGPRAKGATASN